MSGRVLVVGGAGFVGSNLVALLLERSSSEILIVDNLLSAEETNVPRHPAVEFRRASIADDETLAALPKDLDCVYHLATYHGNQSSIANPLADHENNLLTSLKLFDFLSQREVKPRIVYASAGCGTAEKTHDEPEATEETDWISLHHDSPYQISKLVGEMYANYYGRRHDLPVVKARFQNVYGPGEILGAGRWRGTPATVWRNVVPTFIYRALKGLPLLVEHGGTTTRDFVYVGDLVRGLIGCAERGVVGEAYNLASGVETSILELAETILDLTGHRSEVELTPGRPWDRSGRRFGSVTKAAEGLDFRAETSLRAGLAQTVAWTEKHLGEIDACIESHRDRMPGDPAVG